MIDNIIIRGEKKYVLSAVERNKANRLKLTAKQYIIEKENQEFFDRIDPNRPPLFSSVEIETVNACNGRCSFCPVNKDSDPRTHITMRRDLFERIITELQFLNYSGRLGLFSNNEPFLDKRIIDFAKYAREHLPHAYLYLYTNGSLLTLKKYNKIMRYLDYMVIDNYDDTGKVQSALSEIITLCEQNELLDQKTLISIRRQTEVLYTRGGNAPNRGYIEPLNMTCTLPFQQLVIRPDGKLSLCNNDAYGEMTMGDISLNSILDEWYGTPYENIRKSLLGGRKNCALCKKCDSLFHPTKY